MVVDGQGTKGYPVYFMKLNRSPSIETSKNQPATGSMICLTRTVGHPRPFGA